MATDTLPVQVASTGACQAFVPRAPQSLQQTGLSSGQIKSLTLKYLREEGVATGRRIAEQLAIPFLMVAEPLRELKEELLVVYKAGGPLGDYCYELTSAGAERAARYAQQCTYCGAAPVSLDDYIAAVEAQSVRKQKPRLGDIRRALNDLVVSDGLLEQIGMAINSGLGLFLSGAPGNGKTSIAQRVTAAYGETIWIPRALTVCGEIIRLYDGRTHDELPADQLPDGIDAEDLDRRWVCIRRPTIVVGGELTIESLEITKDPVTGINEAPVQLKSNCGTLVVDDFGRQRVDPSEMLNRWIVPLEKRYDYLSLVNGRKLQVPFDQLVIFSSNLDPQRLADEAFLRRIPYKIEVVDPTEEQFRQLIRRTARRMGIDCSELAIDYLLQRAYAGGRQRRFCHGEDLLGQVATFCQFHQLPPRLTREAVEMAVKNYFASV